VSFPLPVCSSLGRAAFPPRTLCPACGGRDWKVGEADGCALEEVTERAGVLVAAVQTDLDRSSSHG
jgi:uncharacterized OB-fold protein